MNSRTFSRFAWGVLLYTVAVILWGAYVRVSGSGAGCGSHWPLCNGEIIPRSAEMKTLVEYGHRLTSGVAFLAAALLLYFSIKSFPRGHLARRAAGWAMMFMMIEALVGAALVLLQLVEGDDSSARAVVIAFHLMNSFLLTGSLALTAWWSRVKEPKLAFSSKSTVFLFGIASLGLMLVGASGAVTALGDTLFPSESLIAGFTEDFSPGAHFLIRLRVIHPVLAVLTAAFVLGLGMKLLFAERPRRNIRLAALLCGTVLLQVTLGFANLLLLAPLPLQLAHLAVANLVWCSFVLVAAAEFEWPLYMRREFQNSGEELRRKAVG